MFVYFDLPKTSTKSIHVTRVSADDSVSSEHFFIFTLNNEHLEKKKKRHLIISSISKRRKKVENNVFSYSSVHNYLIQMQIHSENTLHTFEVQFQLEIIFCLLSYYLANSLQNFDDESFKSK